MILCCDCAKDFGPAQTQLTAYGVVFKGRAPVHPGAEGLNERGAGGHSAGHPAEGRRGCTGQDEERRLQVPSV